MINLIWLLKKKKIEDFYHNLLSLIENKDYSNINKEIESALFKRKFKDIELRINFYLRDAENYSTKLQYDLAYDEIVRAMKTYGFELTDHEKEHLKEIQKGFY